MDDQPTDSLVEEDEHKGDAEAFVGELVGVAMVGAVE
jgi:hypothetical protein